MKKLLKSIGDFFNRLFSGKDALIARYINPAIQVGQFLKKLLDSQLPARLADLTDTQWDDILVDQATKAVPHAIQILEIATCADNEDPNLILQCAVDKIKTMNPALQGHTIADFVVEVAHHMSNGKISRAVLRIAVEIWFQRHYATNPAL